LSQKLPVVQSKDLVRVAQKLGFVMDRQRGSHAVYYRDRDRARVVIPIHGGRDVPPGTLRDIIEDLGVTVDEFRALL
jgi:predicted RNA binding protein YcfA (HicA-like mRNA interferase family)